MKLNVFVLLSTLIAASFANAAYLKTNLIIENSEMVVSYSGTGSYTRHTFPSANILRVISDYNSGSNPKVIVCELRNIQALNPLAVAAVQKFLTDSSSVELECLQRMTSSETPISVDNLKVVVDLAVNPENFRIRDLKSSSIEMLNSGYTTIQVTQETK